MSLEVTRNGWTVQNALFVFIFLFCCCWLVQLSTTSGSYLDISHERCINGVVSDSIKVRRTYFTTLRCQSDAISSCIGDNTIKLLTPMSLFAHGTIITRKYHLCNYFRKLNQRRIDRPGTSPFEMRAHCKDVSGHLNMISGMGNYIQ